VDFTREPMIETVITPREGAKLVVRSSKASAQEEYFVDAVEVVTFGSAIFFRSTEKPKAFLVPASDYEVLEAREARIVLKNVGSDRSIKIAGGREAAVRAPKEAIEEKTEAAAPSENLEGRPDRKKERRRQGRRRRGRDEGQPMEMANGEGRIELAAPEGSMGEQVVMPVLSSLLSPPPLISETISRYKEQFKDAFYTKEEQDAALTMSESDVTLNTSLPEIPLMQPAFGSFETSEEDEEEIYRQRHRMHSSDLESEEPQGTVENKENEDPTV
jgi:hypothetical protein